MTLALVTMVKTIQILSNCYKDLPSNSSDPEI